MEILEDCQEASTSPNPEKNQISPLPSLTYHRIYNANMSKENCLRKGMSFS